MVFIPYALKDRDGYTAVVRDALGKLGELQADYVYMCTCMHLGSSKTYFGNVLYQEISW